METETFFSGLLSGPRRFQGKMSQTPNSILKFSGRRPTLPEVLPSPGERGRQHETEPVSFPKFYKHSNYKKMPPGSPTMVSTASRASPATTRYAESAQKGEKNYVTKNREIDTFWCATTV